MKFKMKSILTVTALAALSGAAMAGEPILNFDGEVGYARLPSANMPEIGENSFTYYSSEDYEGQRLQFQASDAFSLSANLADGVNGPENMLDTKLQILGEGKYWPSFAIGVHDLYGNGPRSAEYIAATKSLGNFEASLGLGWGALSGSNAVFSNGERPAVDKHVFSTEQMFKGDASPFAGVAYRTPINGLTLSADYLEQEDGDNIGYAIQYRNSSRWGVGAYMTSEDNFGFAITLAGNPRRPVTPQDTGSKPVTVIPRALMGADTSPAWYNANSSQDMGEKLGELVADEGARLDRSRITANRASLQIAPTETLVTPKTIGRITRVLAMNMPASVEEFEISVVDAHGTPVSSTVINRSEYESILERDDRNALAFEMAQIKGAKPLKGADVYVAEREVEPLDIGFGVNTNIDLFGGNGIEFTPVASLSYEFTPAFSLNTSASMELYKPSVNLEPTDADVRIRSDRALYRQNLVRLDRATADYYFKLGGALYGRASAGLLETQFAGVSGEMIYADPAWPVALGLDIAAVQKRSPDEVLGFEDYQTTTGFGTLYWDTGFAGVETSLGYGRFLGEDWGFDASIARKFRDGWRVEGGLVVPDRFGKTGDTRELQPSISVSVPLRWTVPVASRTRYGVGIQSGSSDFGAKLNVANTLYPNIREYDAKDYELRWGAFWQ